MTTPATQLPSAETSAGIPAEPHFSLLRLSAGRRVLGACVVLAALWLAVWWAL
jgi:hypothetical protein